MNIEEGIIKFLNYCKFERNLSINTLKSYRNDLFQFQKNIQNSIDISLIDKNIIRKYIYYIDELYKPKSLKRKIATLKSFFSFLEQEEYITFTPFRKIKIKIDNEKILPKIISKSSIEKFFRCAYNYRNNFSNLSHQYKEITRDIAILEMLFYTGIRVSELCKLRISDVDLVNNFIFVIGKGKRERLIPLCNNESLKILNKYKHIYLNKIPLNSNFFLNRDNKPISDQSVRQLIKKYRKIAQISENITPHMFRHTIATLLLENGVDIRNIQTFLGHSSLTVTEIYTHVSISAQREVLKQHHPRNDLNTKLSIDN